MQYDEQSVGKNLLREVIKLADLADYQEGAIVSRTIINKKKRGL